MRKPFAIAVILLLLIGITSLAYGGAAEKATGGVTTSYYYDHVAFNAQETVPAAYLGKGVVSYSGQRGADEFVYHFHVRFVRVEPDQDVAWFAGQVTHTTNGQNLGRWMVFAVHDNAPDGLGGQWTDNEAEALDWVTIGFPNPYLGTSPAIEGNLRVHP